MPIQPKTPGPWHYLHRIDELGVPGALEHEDGRVLGLDWESDDNGLLQYLNSLEQRLARVKAQSAEILSRSFTLLSSTEATTWTPAESDRYKAALERLHGAGQAAEPGRDNGPSSRGAAP